MATPPRAPHWRDAQAHAAEWLERFLAPAYGPGGGHKLIAEPEPTLLRSGASALREVHVTDPTVLVYKRLADGVQAQVGDQATLAALLAARLVRRGLELPVPAAIEGYRLARRQLLATLEAHARPGDGLTHVAPAIADAAPIIVAGLHEMAQEGPVDLDAIDVRVGRDGPAWLPGVVASPQHGPRCDVADAGILLVQGGWAVKGRSDITYRGDPRALLAEEERMRRAVVDNVRRLGVDLVACGGALDEGVRDMLDLAVWTDVPASSLHRLRDATGARIVSTVLDATMDDVGRGDIIMRRRSRDRIVSGPGHAATLELADHAGFAVTDDGERLLRAAGAFLGDGRTVAGGGRWQCEGAAALRRVADAAPGHAPLGVRAAASALDAVADDLVRNMGHDPLAMRVPPDADDVLDPWPCVRHALDAAFSTAIQVLRIDARHDKAASDPSRLRGGTGPAGSPRGMPGDVPPLM